MSKSDKGSDDPAGLLSKLLSGAKQDVAKERAALEAELEQRAQAGKAEASREEARRREEMQRQLIEETRRRNRALSRRDREAAQAGTEEKIGVGDTQVAAQPALISPQERAVPSNRRGGVPVWVMAALVLAAVGLGVGGAFALAPSHKLNIPDVSLTAQMTLRQTVKSASAAGKASSALQAANDKLDALQRELRASLKEQARLATEFKVTATELKEARDALNALVEGADKEQLERERKARIRRLERERRERDRIDVDLDSYNTTKKGR